MTYSPPPAAAPRQDRTTLYGWLGIITGLICCGVLGIVFGALSLREAQASGRSKVLGWIAIAIGIVSILGGLTVYLTNWS